MRKISLAVLVFLKFFSMRKRKFCRDGGNKPNFALQNRNISRTPQPVIHKRSAVKILKRHEHCKKGKKGLR